ncbi:TPA: hypothetical protein TXT63_000695 [Streptococcus suis]|nr:hypothetical protein [Streptococcus suis]
MKPTIDVTNLNLPFANGQATNAYNEVVALFQKGAYAGAIVLIFLGDLDIGTNFGENGNRVAVMGGFFKIIGGAIIGAAALLLDQAKM